MMKINTSNFGIKPSDHITFLYTDIIFKRFIDELSVKNIRHTEFILWKYEDEYLPDDISTSLAIFPVDYYYIFKNWIKNNNIGLVYNLKKKMYSNDKLWYPSEFEVIINEHDELATFLKLKYQY